jgi:hypothetical protein
VATSRKHDDLPRYSADLQQLLLNLRYLLSRNDLRESDRERFEALLQVVGRQSEKLVLVLEAESENRAA